GGGAARGPAARVRGRGRAGGGAPAVIPAARKTPTPPPAAPPITPMASDSPITCATIRRDRQPSALSVPKSRTRLATAAIVSRLATVKAEMSTRTDSQRPRSLASLAVLDSDPVTCLARLDALVTVAFGSRLSISCCTAGILAALVAVT